MTSDKAEPTNTNSNFLEFLRVNNKFLDAEAELNRLFCFNTLDQNASKSRLKRIKSDRCLFVPLKKTWPPPVRIGITMEKLDNGFYSFVHSKEYQVIQKKFIQVLDSQDPNNLSVRILFVYIMCLYIF